MAIITKGCSKLRGVLNIISVRDYTFIKIIKTNTYKDGYT